MQTTVQKTNAVRFGSGILSISKDNGSTFTNLGALKDAKLNLSKKVTEITADNSRLPPKVKIDGVTFSASLFEIFLDHIKDMDGMSEYTGVAGTLTTVTAEVLQASGTFQGDAPIFFANKNGDNTKVGSIVVKNGTTSLVEGTDYEIILLNGRTGVVRVGTGLTLTGAGLNVGYTYTPYSSKTLLYKDIQETLTMNMFKFENFDSNGKVFRITFFKAYNASNMEFSFPGDDATDSALTAGIELKAYPTSDQKMFEVYDEQCVS